MFVLVMWATILFIVGFGVSFIFNTIPTLIIVFVVALFFLFICLECKKSKGFGGIGLAIIGTPCLIFLFGVALSLVIFHVPWTNLTFGWSLDTITSWLFR